MKANRLLGILSALVITIPVHADYSFHLEGSANCNQIEGVWSGKGRLKNWVIGTCIYRGTGTVGPLDDSGHFTVYGTADKEYGTSLCPAHASQQLTAVCSNGVITIKTEYGKMQGTFTENSGSAKGTLSVTPGVEADVSLQFYR